MTGTEDLYGQDRIVDEAPLHPRVRRHVGWWAPVLLLVYLLFSTATFLISLVTMVRGRGRRDRVKHPER
jgi:hypothetical protein